MKVLIGEPFPYEELRGKPVLEVMTEVQELMQSTTMNWWYSSGTALGLVREECGFILHDKDIDLEVQIKDENEIENILLLFKRAGYNPVRRIQVNNKEAQLVLLGRDNILIDFFFYYLEEGIYNNYSDMGVLSIPKSMIDNKGLHKGFVMPLPYDEYLTLRYGDWRTPKEYKAPWEEDAGIALKRW